MFKKLTIIIILWFCFVLYTVSCCGPTDYCVVINSINVNVEDTSGQVIIGVDKEITGDEFVLNLTINNTINLCNNKSLPIINSAYATSCEHDVYFANDSVINISIIADKDYNSGTPAGSGLNEYFKIPPVKELNVFTDNESFPFRSLQGPEQGGVYTYTVRLTMQSGKIIEAQANPIYIQQ